MEVVIMSIADVAKGLAGKKAAGEAVSAAAGEAVKAATGADLEAIAKEVIAGKWGVGAERTKKLTEAGYDAAAVQKLVNELMKK
ncbi:MAG: hypothetical protein IKO10_08035 [Lachnospiraceae bacterium]|nr:hypothetical protein [Lachnospiraceae bacterium]